MQCSRELLVQDKRKIVDGANLDIHDLLATIKLPHATLGPHYPS